ncbi:purine nucleoside permease, partial [Bacillus sp. AFS075960]
MLSAAAFSLAACATAPSIAQDNQGNAGNDFAETGAQGRPVKVMIITMFGPEGQAWLDRLGPWRDVAVPGLSPDYPAVHCNRQD